MQINIQTLTVKDLENRFQEIVALEETDSIQSFIEMEQNDLLLRKIITELLDREANASCFLLIQQTQENCAKVAALHCLMQLNPCHPIAQEAARLLRKTTYNSSLEKLVYANALRIYDAEIKSFIQSSQIRIPKFEINSRMQLN